MPLLEDLVLWNGRRGEACAFIYHKDTANGQATLTWRGTWNLELSVDLVQSWYKASVQVAPESLWIWVQSQQIEEVISSHGDAIYHLRLPSRVIDSVSLRQIRKEGTM